MTAILFSKIGQITIGLTFLAYIFLCNLMNLAAIFQVLEHLNDFEITGYGGHFGFFKISQNYYQASLSSYISLCKFDEAS